MQTKLIWCCEDDESIRDIEVYTLNSVGFKARGFEDGIAFWSALQSAASASKNRTTQDNTASSNALPDLVVLDIMLPKMDGLEVLKKMKSSTTFSAIPVIMASAKGTEYDKIQGLDFGADYYIAKPFGVMELASCVKAVLRRTNPKTNTETLQAKGILLNRDAHTVTVDSNTVNLTLKEYELLACFLENKGRSFSREELFNKVWGWDYVGTTRTLDIHIKTLRQKISPYGTLIQTVRGVGYRFNE